MFRSLCIFLIVLLFPTLAYANSRLDDCLPYKEEISSILESEGVSSDYFYLAVCESGCRIKTSSKGARGFFQVTYPIYKLYKPEECSVEDIDDVRCNAIAAARYIKHLQKRFSKMSTVIKAYNRGGTNLLKHGTTKEANGLSRCVMNYVRTSN